MTSETDQFTATFKCLHCGADPATLELPDDHTEDSITKCKACGMEVARWGDIKAETMKLAKAEAQSMLTGAFKDLKGWKVK